MAIFHDIGNSLMDSEEILLGNMSGEFPKSLRDDNNITRTTGMEPDPHPPGSSFKPIGIGKPLRIEIASVYTGEYKKFLGGRKDAIVVSGIKSSQTFQATSKAINIKSSNVDEKSFLRFQAFDDGTPIVFYTSAVYTENMLVTFKIILNIFDTKLFETISGLMNSPAWIPVFMPAASNLLGGSQLINIGSKLGDAVFSGRANLSSTISIQFKSPILPPTEPREYVLYSERDKLEFANLKVSVVDVGGSSQLRLVHKTDNSEYNGLAPYMIILLNGQTREDLSSFAPTLASTAILKKFYGSDNKTGEITSLLQNAMVLYNDSTYRSKGERIKKQIDKYSKDSEDYKNLKILYEDYSANI